jgi:hypothetical protein
MERPRMKPIRHSGTLVSSAELAEIIGTDLQTGNNWIGRGIITRSSLGDGNSGIGCSRGMRSTGRL